MAAACISARPHNAAPCVQLVTGALRPAQTTVRCTSTARHLRSPLPATYADASTLSWLQGYHHHDKPAALSGRRYGGAVLHRTVPGTVVYPAPAPEPLCRDFTAALRPCRLGRPVPPVRPHVLPGRQRSTRQRHNQQQYCCVSEPRGCVLVKTNEHARRSGPVTPPQASPPCSSPLCRPTKSQHPRPRGQASMRHRDAPTPPARAGLLPCRSPHPACASPLEPPM